MSTEHIFIYAYLAVSLLCFNHCFAYNKSPQKRRRVGGKEADNNP